ncbi:unnamed protein product [Heterobilharzia americana]|nr:unnamed protein product [Heterobilharzia americana]
MCYRPFSKDPIVTYYCLLHAFQKGLAATLLDIVSGVGEVGDDIEKARKHAKWKAVYISKCLKSGKVPVSGPVPNTDAASIPSISGLGKADNFFSNSLNVPTVSVPEPYSCAPEQPSKPDLPSVSGRISPNKWFDIEKEIKYALSASNYQDEVTTEKHLIRALTLLRGKTEKY